MISFYTFHNLTSGLNLIGNESRCTILTFVLSYHNVLFCCYYLCTSLEIEFRDIDSTLQFSGE